MYLDFFQFQRSPFHVTPDPAFLYASPGHREALSALIYGVMLRKGFIALTGEVGMGKTTILRAFLERIDPEQTQVIYLLDANLSFDALLQTMLFEFGAVLDADAFMRVNQLHLILIDQFRQGRNVVLIVDEAQNMPIETLEGLRVLSNLETATDKLLQIIFCGQPEFDDMLDQPELRQLKQRIAVRATVMPLTAAEGIRYIQHRLALAGAADRGIFTPGAIRAIVKEAQGIPRRINILCDNALVTAFGYQQRRVNASVVREVIADRKVQTRPRVRRWRWPAVGVAATVMAAGVFLIWASDFGFLSEVQRSLAEAQHSLLDRLAGAGSSTGTVRSELVEPGASSMNGSPTESVLHLAKAEDSERIDEVKALRLSPPPVIESAGVPTQVPSIRASNSPAGDLTMPIVAAEQAGKPQWVTRVVKRGDRLIDLVEAVYGGRDERLVQRVQRHNSQIKNSHLIHIGDRLVFPPADNPESVQ
jgi:general secretion pathway protein A